MKHLGADGIAVDVHPVGGMLDRLVITYGGRTIQPLHRAPWVDDPGEVPATAPPHLARLTGDFFCAPFGKPDHAADPPHGWAANGTWSAEAASGDASTGIFRLDHTILGARLRKTIALRAGHPVVYQRHDFTGGHGAVPIAHHAMIRAPGGARLSFSAKAFGATPATALETDPARGRSIFAYPQRFDALSAVRLATGEMVDARLYPFAQGHEDFLTMFDPPGTRIGWSAALAQADGFLFFAVKDARVLPQTSLWMSNGGRRYPPWSSRHNAVLGIEECCTQFGDGTAVSAAPNALSAAGFRTALSLKPEGSVSVRYALGAIPADPAWTEVAAIAMHRGLLRITDTGGLTVAVPFDDGFFNDIEGMS